MDLVPPSPAAGSFAVEALTSRLSGRPDAPKGPGLAHLSVPHAWCLPFLISPNCPGEASPKATPQVEGGAGTPRSGRGDQHGALLPPRGAFSTYFL